MKLPIRDPRQDGRKPLTPQNNDTLPLDAGRLDYLASGQRPWILLILLCLALYLPGISSLPPVDRDEARYIQATRQMLETNDFLHIRFQNEARNKKPAGIYWLQAASVWAFSDAESPAIWPYRLVSLISATAAVLMIFFFGSRIFDPRTGLAAAGLAAASLNAVFEAHMATTDATLLAIAVAAQGSLGLIYLGFRRGEKAGLVPALVFWGMQGLGILIKGPVLPAISLLTILALVFVDRRRRWLMQLHPWFGLPLTLAIVLPWLWLIQQATDGAFLKESLGHDLLGKMTGIQEAHGAPPFYYLALLPITFWPGSLFIGLGAVWAWRERTMPATKLLLAWLVPFWVLLELMPTKLPHYVLPLYPALALIVARALIAHTEEGFMLRPRWWLRAPAIVWSVVSVVLGVGLFALPPLLKGPQLAMIAGVIPAAFVATVLWQLWAWQRGRVALTNLGVMVLLSLTVSVSALGLILPALDSLWISRSAADLVNSIPNRPQGLAVVGDAEPSLVFLLGTETAFEPADLAATDLAAGRIGMAFVERRDDAAFQKTIAQAGKSTAVLGVASGFDYSNGRQMTLVLYRLNSAAS